MGDLISRAAATEALSIMQGIVAENEVRKGISMAWQQIADLPSAQPERKKGKWTVTSLFIKCSECGEAFMLIPQNYCPNCGAKMVEEKENE